MAISVANLTVKISASSKRPDRARDLSARDDRTITTSSPAAHRCNVMEGGVKLYSVNEVMFWDGRPGCVLKECRIEGHQRDCSIRNSHDIRLVFDLEGCAPDYAAFVRDFYSWCPVAEFRMPPGVA